MKNTYSSSSPPLPSLYTILLLTLVDPLSMNSQKALEQVGNNLQRQYERWQPRARYKQLLDPTTEDARKLCIALRKNAKVPIPPSLVPRPLPRFLLLACSIVGGCRI